jgi:hypothetical protein
MGSLHFEVRGTRGMKIWHKLDCNQAQIKDEDCRCRCAEPISHVGAFRVAGFLGLVTKGDNRKQRND